jgi:hypothetical protein
MKTSVEEVGWYDVDSTDLAEGTDWRRSLVNTIVKPGFIKVVELHDWVSDCQFLKKDSASCM